MSNSDLNNREDWTAQDGRVIWYDEKLKARNSITTRDHTSSGYIYWLPVPTFKPNSQQHHCIRDGCNGPVRGTLERRPDGDAWICCDACELIGPKRKSVDAAWDAWYRNEMDES